MVIVVWCVVIWLYIDISFFSGEGLEGENEICVVLRYRCFCSHTC